MKCNCVTNIQDKFLNEFKIKEQPMVKAQILEVSILFSENPSTCTYSNIELTVMGKNKPITKQILHSFCPFCGTKIKD